MDKEQRHKLEESFKQIEILSKRQSETQAQSETYRQQIEQMRGEEERWQKWSTDMAQEMMKERDLYFKQVKM